VITVLISTNFLKVLIDLKSSGLYENSVVLITTDNGGGEGPFNANRNRQHFSNPDLEENYNCFA
jgi:arylsulfatase A-like enzyme